MVVSKLTTILHRTNYRVSVTTIGPILIFRGQYEVPNLFFSAMHFYIRNELNYAKKCILEKNGVTTVLRRAHELFLVKDERNYLINM